MSDAPQSMGHSSIGQGLGPAFTNVAALIKAPMLDAVIRTTESYGKAYLALQEELFRFTATRLQRDGELGQALASTRTWESAAKVQQEWAASTLQDYTSETTRLLEIAVDAGSKIVQMSVPQTEPPRDTTAQSSSAEAVASSPEKQPDDKPSGEKESNEAGPSEAARPRAPRRATPTG